jgi:hypothetical protein
MKVQYRREGAVSEKEKPKPAKYNLQTSKNISDFKAFTMHGYNSVFSSD